MSEDKKEGILRIYVQNADGHMLCVPGDKFDQWAEGQKEIQKKEPREINGDMIEACIKQGYISTSKLHGYYGLGYPTANRIVLRLEQEGYISAPSPTNNRRTFLNPDVDKMVNILKEYIK